jgi:hypothetical protein
MISRPPVKPVRVNRAIRVPCLKMDGRSFGRTKQVIREWFLHRHRPPSKEKVRSKFKVEISSVKTAATYYRGRSK